MSERPDIPDNSVGEEIRALREAAGLSQGDLAELAGTNQQTVQRIESGLTSISRATPKLLRVLHHLGMRSDVPKDDLNQVYVEAYDKKNFKNQINSKQGAAQKIGIDLNPSVDVIDIRKNLNLHFSHEVEPGILTVDDTQLSQFDLFDFVLDRNRAFAVYVSISDMAPELEPGDILLIDTAAPPIPGVTCLFQSNSDKKPLSTIKRLVSSSKDEWYVRSWSPPRDLTLLKSEWPVCMRVTGRFSRR